MTIYPPEHTEQQKLSAKFKAAHRECAQELLAAKEFYNQLVRKQKNGQGGRANIQNIKRMADVIANYKRMMLEFESGLLKA